MESIEFCYFGSCLMSAVVSPLLNFSGRPVQWSLRKGAIHKSPGAYCLDDAIQFARFLRGEVEIPEKLRDLCDMERGNEWQPSWSDALEATELVCLEITSPVGISFGPYTLCRAGIIVQILAPLAERQPDLKQVANSWFYQGMLAGNDTVRASAAERLAASVTADLPASDLARAVLLESRPRRRDVAGFVEGIATIRDLMLGRPLGIMTCTHRYMPDGRPLPYPPDIVDMTIAAAKKLDLPVFQPSEVVRRYGVERAMREDLAHYKEEFCPALADAFLSFIIDMMAEVRTKRISNSPAVGVPPPASRPAQAEDRPLGVIRPPPGVSDLLAVIGEVANVPPGEIGCHRIRRDTVSVRHYPFPYVAALAISNDPDSMTPEAFEDWHGFVNGRRNTAYGDGLGLEVGDAFWVWAPRRHMCLHAQFPKDFPRAPSQVHDRIVELARLGWLDTMHSLTAFDSPAPPLIGRPGEECANPPHLRVTRDDARYALDLMDRLGIKPTVYTNHSLAITNIAGEWPWYHRGDDPRDKTYCLDLLRQFGFRFHWLDVGLEMEKFGDYLEYKYWPPLSIPAAAHRFDWNRWLRTKIRDETGALHLSAIELPADDEKRRVRLIEIFNQTLFKTRCLDGSSILAFKRFRGVDRPAASTFPVQVTAARLDDLEKANGAVIIYQHFGNWSLIGRGHLGRIRPILPFPPVFDQHGVECWRDIAERQRAGRLFVTTTSRLLNWLWVRQGLSMSVEKTQAKWIVTLRTVECPVLGSHPVSPMHLNGISLLVPEAAPEVVCIVAGQSTRIPLTREADPAFPGYHAVYQSWEALEWPER